MSQSVGFLSLFLCLFVFCLSSVCRGFSRGQEVSQKDLVQFVDSLGLPAESTKTLRDLSPSTYIGLAPVLAREACGQARAMLLASPKQSGS